MTTPLGQMIESIRLLAPGAEQQKCINVLEKVCNFPDHLGTELSAIHTLSTFVLRDLGWKDATGWILKRVAIYQEALETLAQSAQRAVSIAPAPFMWSWVTNWNFLLRGTLEPGRWPLHKRSVLSAFSSAVDATYSLGAAPSTSLDDLINHAAMYAGLDVDSLLGKAFAEYDNNRDLDRRMVRTVVEVIASLMFAYRKAGANNKPTLEPNSQAEKWARKFHLDMRQNKLKFGGGGAALNMADVVGGLGTRSEFFWPYHPEALAGCPLFAPGRPILFTVSGRMIRTPGTQQRSARRETGPMVQDPAILFG